jgi:peptidoglycan/LPS O-acetylase OafA/YrhL
MHINYISWIGKISYSIYLFHAIFFRSINECFGFGKNSPIELFICMICFPVFLFFCYYLDKLGAKIASLQKKLPLKAQPSA